MGEWRHSSSLCEATPHMEVSVQFDAPTALPPGKSFLVHFEYEDVWVTDPIWTFRRKQTSLTPAEN